MTYYYYYYYYYKQIHTDYYLIINYCPPNQSSVVTNIQKYEKYTKNKQTGNYVIQRSLVDPKNAIIVSQKVSRQGRLLQMRLPKSL